MWLLLCKMAWSFGNSYSLRNKVARMGSLAWSHIQTISGFIKKCLIDGSSTIFVSATIKKIPALMLTLRGSIFVVKYNFSAYSWKILAWNIFKELKWFFYTLKVLSGTFIFNSVYAVKKLEWGEGKFNSVCVCLPCCVHTLQSPVVSRYHLGGPCAPFAESARSACCVEPTWQRCSPAFPPLSQPLTPQTQ